MFTKVYFKTLKVKFTIKFVIYNLFFILKFLFHPVLNYPSVLFQIAPNCTNLPHPDFALYFIFSQKICVHYLKRNVFIGN